MRTTARARRSTACTTPKAATIACPVLVLWGADGALPRFYPDPLELWAAIAPGAAGRAVADSGHFLAEDQPDAVTRELLEFLT